MATDGTLRLGWYVVHRKVGGADLTSRAEHAFEVSRAQQASNHGLSRWLHAGPDAGGFSLRGCRTSDRQTLATLGAAGVDHGAAAAGLHAHQKTVGTGAANF